MSVDFKTIEINLVSDAELAKISLLATPQDVLAIVRTPPEIENGLTISYPAIACDTIQDPGNLGTILRVADWFGFKSVFLSPACVEWQSPKVIQASMGSFMRTAITVTQLEKLFQMNKAAVYAAVLEGASIFETNFSSECILVLGNEGHGIDKALNNYLTFPITIPRLGTAESLNVGVAAGIICAQIQRKIFEL